ncbi:putative tRNA (guanosine-2'-O-)-methyltransferase [Myxococcus xanthus DK 1622]|uniref:tRNA (Guanosine-2'-O-)-methyltransferase n=1 Tax=Myxococcus xanthus (strain DK1622) TaxID=246197 RepID=Q1DC94_MYXXD|nr:MULTISPECIES: RNA methyltransferase [Myxococcus]ABF87185.1 putative tRNA (guanosine-2'-O-)-methyltransferase [Myxococcus xanthus DK 1622]NOJ57683.1 RNA methyltransferase [Myxococcus xanthus]QPM81110.1 RNA methyltransferase [Myxococcus xanthus]QVW70169.1 RNA methyltransferase [Myxococcus xanthus DZ2]QZZ49003.1 tRNA (guanosine(18)-2'-O)-methyltransferase [Myxococcus xanthus]
MSGGGARYERYEREQFEPEQFLLDVRKEKIDRVVSHRTRNFTVVLDRLEDSFNMAAVLRTCESMGVQEVHIIINPEAPFVPNSRVAQGCDKWLDVKLYRTFAECREHLKSRGFSLYASAIQEGATSLYTLRFDGKMALVFGNERRGVSEDVLAGVDGTFWVPMKGFSQSLNISAAASACISRAIAWRDEHLGQSGDLSPEDAQALRERFYVLAIKQRKRLFKKAP